VCRHTPRHTGSRSSTYNFPLVVCKQGCWGFPLGTNVMRRDVLGGACARHVWFVCLLLLYSMLMAQQPGLGQSACLVLPRFLVLLSCPAAPVPGSRVLPFVFIVECFAVCCRVLARHRDCATS
jgi:hypothetical protein